MHFDSATPFRSRRNCENTRRRTTTFRNSALDETAKIPGDDTEKIFSAAYEAKYRPISQTLGPEIHPQARPSSDRPLVFPVPPPRRDSPTTHGHRKNPPRPNSEISERAACGPLHAVRSGWIFPVPMRCGGFFAPGEIRDPGMLAFISGSENNLDWECRPGVFTHTFGA